MREVTHEYISLSTHALLLSEKSDPEYITEDPAGKQALVAVCRCFSLSLYLSVLPGLLLAVPHSPVLLQHFIEGFLFVLQQTLQVLLLLLILSSLPFKFFLLLSHLETDISKLPIYLFFIYL